MCSMISQVRHGLNTTDRASFDKVEKWVEKARREGGEDLLIVLAGNKADQSEGRLVSFDEGQKKASELGVLFFETSAKLRNV